MRMGISQPVAVFYCGRLKKDRLLNANMANSIIIILLMHKMVCTVMVSANGPKSIVPNGSAQEVAI